MNKIATNFTIHPLFCPTCGGEAVVSIEDEPTRDSIYFVGEGLDGYAYGDDSAAVPDGKLPRRNADGLRLVACDDGHEWWAKDGETEGVQRWLLVVWGDVEPELLGPWPTDRERDAVAQGIRAGVNGKGHDLIPINTGTTGLAGLAARSHPAYGD